MTTPPNPLTELAERVGRLTGPCRETDGLIYRSIDPVIEQCWKFWSPAQLETIVPRYTESLDAAMTLAVKGYHILAIHEQPAAWIVRIGSRSNDREPTVDIECDRLESALCSAWLQVRARAALENSHG